jgi:DNA-binding transcriptional LysR family regulator
MRGPAIRKWMSSREPSWDLYRSFRACLEHRSLSGAARALGLTQPTLARHVDELEASLGRRLFSRSPAGLLPTDEALALAPYAETIAATAAALLRAAGDDPARLGGTVRISASEVMGVERLPPVLAALRRRHPALVIELAVSNEVDDLLRRDADIAVRMTRPTQSVLVARRVRPVEIGLYAHQDYLARRGTPASLADMAAFDVIGFARETPALRAFVERFPIFRRETFAFRSDNQLAHLALLRVGFGIGAAQVPIAEREPRLVRLLAEEFAAELETWIVMHEDLRSTPRCRAAFDALVEAFG